jgi:hypothetical protein
MISPAILEFMALQTRKRSRGFEQGELYISELQRLKLKILSTAAGAEKAEVSQRESASFQMKLKMRLSLIGFLN